MIRLFYAVWNEAGSNGSITGGGGGGGSRSAARDERTALGQAYRERRRQGREGAAEVEVAVEAVEAFEVAVLAE